jgi:hypothetical protein
MRRNLYWGCRRQPAPQLRFVFLFSSASGVSSHFQPESFFEEFISDRGAGENIAADGFDFIKSPVRFSTQEALWG